MTCAGAFLAGSVALYQGQQATLPLHGFENRGHYHSRNGCNPGRKCHVENGVRPDGSKEGGGTVTMSVNGKPVRARARSSAPFSRHGLEPFEVGRDSITSVDPAYKDKGSFEFTGKIEKITFELPRINIWKVCK